MTALTSSRPHATRLPLVLLASAVVAGVVAAGTAAVLRDDLPVPQKASSSAHVGPIGYDPMQAYVNMLIYWHQHPEWMPNR